MRLIDFLCECKEIIDEDKAQKQNRVSAPKPKMRYRPKRHR